MNAEIVKVPFHGDEILTVDQGGRPFIVLRPVIEGLGLDYSAQYRRLQRRPWATVAVLATQDQFNNMVAVDVRTFLMLLATVDTTRVAEAIRPKVIQYQTEVADAIESYWTKGGAINTRATETQLADLIGQAKAQAEVLQALRGIVNPDWLEAQARLVGSRALGIEPQLDPATRPLTVDEYLIERGMPRALVEGCRSGFGKKLAQAYRAETGREPVKGDRNIAGRITKVNCYSERERPLFDQVWRAHYAPAATR